MLYQSKLQESLKINYQRKNNIQYLEFKTGGHNIIGEKLDKSIEYITNMKL